MGKRAAARPGHRQTSVFVVGTLFSGSTLIGRDITTHLENAHYFGELLNYTELPGLTHPGSGWGCNPCRVLRNDICPHFTPSLKATVTHEDILEMHNKLAASLSASVVVDGSKYVAWMRRALEQRDATSASTSIKAILTTRNPIAFAISHRHRTGEELWQAATIWRDTYIDALRTANTHGVPLLVVRYEDYMSSREHSLNQLSEFLNCALRAKPENQLLHDVGGNWSSLVPYASKDAMTRFINNMKDSGARAEAQAFVEHATSYWVDGEPQADNRWKCSLESWEVGAVLGAPGLADIASILGYNIAELAAQAIKPQVS